MTEGLLKTNGNGGKTDIGTWFVTYNTPKMWANNFGHGFPIKYQVLLPDGSYGLPQSDDIGVIDFLLSKLAEAKIDFIMFDLTNGGLNEKIPYGVGNEWIVDNAVLTCERISKWNAAHQWKIRYAVAVGCYPMIRGNQYKDGVLVKEGFSIGECTELQAESVYKKFVNNETFGKDYYTLDGKPLLIIHDWGENVCTVPHGWNYYRGDRSFGDLFTVRNAQGGQAGTYGWQTQYGTQVHPEVEVVCPGQNPHLGGINIRRNYGKYYLNDWATVLNNPSPRIVMITSFNDYHENSAIFTADTSQCDITADEHWIDEDKNERPSMYFDITKEKIAELRKKNNDIIMF